MRYLREAALVVAAFTLGTAVTSFIALREHDWTRPESLILGYSTALLVGWLICTQVGTGSSKAALRNLAVSLGLNMLLGSFVVYYALWVRQQDYWLWSRSEAALSLLSPRFLHPSPIEIRPYSPKFVEGYSVEACSGNRLHPNFIGDRCLGSDLSIDDVVVETVHGQTILKILMRSDLYNKLGEYCRTHHEGIAYVVNGDRVLLEDWGMRGGEPVVEGTILIRVTGGGLGRLTADRFLLWFKPNPKPEIGRT